MIGPSENFLQFQLDQYQAEDEEYVVCDHCGLEDDHESEDCPLVNEEEEDL